MHESRDMEDEDNDILLNGLSHQSHLILRAEGLATGFCKDVHGQVYGPGRGLTGPQLPCLSSDLRDGSIRPAGLRRADPKRQAAF